MVQQECSVCRESAAERAPQSLASTCVAASVWRLRQRARLLRGSSELCCCYTERLGGATAAAATAACSGGRRMAAGPDAPLAARHFDALVCRGAEASVPGEGLREKKIRG
eukprot:scaffold77178_cov36-Phaeocystis_antarctica.AAC.1